MSFFIKAFCHTNWVVIFFKFFINFFKIIERRLPLIIKSQVEISVFQFETWSVFFQSIIYLGNFVYFYQYFSQKIIIYFQKKCTIERYKIA